MAKPENPTESPATAPFDAATELAHALCAPVDGVLAMAELLQRQPLTKTAQVQVQAILQTAARMERLLRIAVQAGAPAQALDLSATGLRDLIDHIEAQWRMKAAGQAAQVLISCNAPADLRVMIDAAAVQRLLDTLIETALDANAGGAIELQLVVRLEAEGRVVVTGRLEAPGAAIAPGGAAALALCQTLARQMRGDLRRAENPGAGALTTFELRLDSAGEALAADDEADQEDGPLPPRTHLLIVDDNATNRIVAAALCEMFGCTSETAEDGVEALEAARARPFDLILMDIKMPRMDGIEATKAIRALPGPAADTPIVALTANADADAAAAYLAAGMQAVVDKPIKPDQLLSTLQRVLSGAEEAPAKQSSAA